MGWGYKDSISYPCGDGRCRTDVFKKFFRVFLIDSVPRFHYAKDMKHSLCAWVREAIAESIRNELHIDVSVKEMRLPARGAAVGCAAALSAGADAVRWAEQLNKNLETFSAVLGVLPVKRVRAENGWLLFDLSDALYIAAAKDAAMQCGKIPARHEIYPLHRLRMIARYADAGCPADERVQRTLLLAFAANETPTKANITRAEEAILTMSHHLPPAERSTLLRQCGTAARAMAALLYDL